MSAFCSAISLHTGTDSNHQVSSTHAALNIKKKRLTVIKAAHRSAITL